VTSVFGDDAATLAMCEYEVAVGRPSVEILRVARERSCDVIVMSSHGLTGARKLFFGSTTERVLRETTVPVLVTPPEDPWPVHVEDAGARLRRIVVPVDLSPASVYQTRVAGGLADALNLPLILVHVIEPARSRVLARLNLGGMDFSQRATAEEALEELAATIPQRLRRETLIVFGDPAEEASRVVHYHQAGLVVMGLHRSPLLAPRMGSVTYRMLCLSPTLLLALPPKITQRARRPMAASLASFSPAAC
jgi:nucleotide-binding universal stress UspA family protein